ncbi:MAG: RNase P subunit p30 family protein [Candidatus Altiarchaeota archaeon]
MHYTDLFSSPNSVEFGKHLGWNDFCAVNEYRNHSDFRKFAEEAEKHDTLAGALITSEPTKNARTALDFADLTIVDGRTEDVCREASECYDVDLIVNPEANEERDLIRQRSSGLDDIMAAFMAERGIGYLVNIGNILHATGVRRAQTVGRVAQNLRLAKRYGVNVVLSCGARNSFDVRTPQDIILFAANLGLSEGEARNAVTKNPQHYVDRAADRNNPDVLMSGLRVLSWGQAERKQKRKYGWY